MNNYILENNLKYKIIQVKAKIEYNVATKIKILIQYAFINLQNCIFKVTAPSGAAFSYI